MVEQEVPAEAKTGPTDSPSGPLNEACKTRPPTWTWHRGHQFLFGWVLVLSPQGGRSLARKWQCPSPLSPPSRPFLGSATTGNSCCESRTTARGCPMQTPQGEEEGHCTGLSFADSRGKRKDTAWGCPMCSPGGRPQPRTTVPRGPAAQWGLDPIEGSRPRTERSSRG